jgi:hypothetical protein
MSIKAIFGASILEDRADGREPILILLLRMHIQNGAWLKARPANQHISCNARAGFVPGSVLRIWKINPRSHPYGGRCLTLTIVE